MRNIRNCHSPQKIVHEYNISSKMSSTSRYHPYAVKEEVQVQPKKKKNIVPVLASTYSLNKSKTKKITIALNAADKFNVTVLLENSARPEEMVILSPEDWKRLKEQRTNISHYLASLFCKGEETEVVELADYKITAGTLYGKPTVLFYSKLTDEGRFPNIALQVGTWNQIWEYLTVITTHIHQGRQWSDFCREYFDAFVRNCLKELEEVVGLCRFYAMCMCKMAANPPILAEV